MNKIIKIIFKNITALSLCVTGCFALNSCGDAENTEIQTLKTPAPAAVTRGTAGPIPGDIRQIMRGISMPDDASISFDELSYLSIPYMDFGMSIKTGHMVVANELADEVLDIFEELLNISYPIESMELIDYFYDKQTDVLDSLDRASMGSNNTSAFCYRVVNGTNRLSNHALGRAIDLNPKINPYVTVSGYVSPGNAAEYADRSEKPNLIIENTAMIHKDDEVYNIFISHGWEWGGEIWSGSYYDYQHFQKPKAE